MRKRNKSAPPEIPLKDTLTRFQKGDPRALSRLISMAEDRETGIIAVLNEIFDGSSRTGVIGITGSPGAGKSTLCNSFIKYFRNRKESVGVIAVDPVSPFTGGAILGDRIRLSDHFNDEGVFIRSLSTRGKLGGLSLATRQVVQLCISFGFDRLLLETVGVGQNEVDIRKMADVTLVVLSPDWGDSVQALKAGLLEIGDIFVVHKADREGANQVASEIRAMLELKARKNHPVMLTSIQKGETLEPLFMEVTSFFKVNPSLIEERKQRGIRDTVEEFVTDYVVGESRKWIRKVLPSKKNPYLTIQKFLNDHPPGELFK